MSNIADNISSIKNELKDFAGKIIAVSKYVNEEAMIQAYDAGIRDFAESRAQDAIAKINNLPEDMQKNSTWHFIGHLQTNKAKFVVGNFDYVHSVDSLKLASLINDLADANGIQQKILLQVNVANESAKFGFSEKELFEVLEDILNLKNISVEGLMIIAPLLEDCEELSEVFKKGAMLKNKIKQEFNFDIKELSMGMSNDYKIAIKEGSTMIRLGSKIFKYE